MLGNMLVYNFTVDSVLKVYTNKETAGKNVQLYYIFNFSSNEYITHECTNSKINRYSQYSEMN